MTAHPVHAWAAEHGVPLDTWATAVVTIEPVGAPPIQVVGLGLGRRGRPGSPRPWLGADHVEVLTAWNPNSSDQPRDVNDAANARLAARLADELPAATVLPATGASPDGSWSEPGFAVLDADPAAVLALATAFGQHATYRWDPEGWWVVACHLPAAPLPLPAGVRCPR